MIRLTLSFILVLLIALPSLAKASYVEEKDYLDITDHVPITEQEPADIEIFFWYGCASCYQVSHHFSQWPLVQEGKVSLDYTPAVLRSDWRMWSKLYFALKQTGYLRQYHQAVFKAIHIDKKAFPSFDMVKALFQSEHQQAISDSYNRAATNFLVKQAEQRYKILEISSVPSILIKGRYLVTADMAQTTSRMREIAAYLLEVKQ